jgi:hypothetical protein
MLLKLTPYGAFSSSYDLSIETALCIYCSAKAICENRCSTRSQGRLKRHFVDASGMHIFKLLTSRNVHVCLNQNIAFVILAIKSVVLKLGVATLFKVAKLDI